jgi:hypothetical protein
MGEVLTASVDASYACIKHGRISAVLTDMPEAQDHDVLFAKLVANLVVVDEQPSDLPGVEFGQAHAETGVSRDAADRSEEHVHHAESRMKALEV